MMHWCEKCKNQLLPAGAKCNECQHQSISGKYQNESPEARAKRLKRQRETNKAAYDKRKAERAEAAMRNVKQDSVANTLLHKHWSYK